MNRRSLVKTLAGTAVAAGLLDRAWPQKRRIDGGIFKAAWDSLKQYQTPDWFRDAKFGIWAHWTAQCVPEQGDWYARQMYIQGTRQNKFHVERYGHPSKFGFMEIDNLWKAERWEPEALMGRYARAGAKYFVSLANHHDNFDCYNSSHQQWNSVRVGPKKDIVGIWAKIAREHGLRFGVSNHSAHAWHWLQPAYGYDAEGAMAGVPYDGFTAKAAGKGKWWEGLDPQHLYTGANMPMPKGISSIAEAQQWHEKHDRIWTEDPPAGNPQFVETWFLRCRELIDKYQPDLLYFDNTELPLGQTGLNIAAHFYNTNIKRHGRLEAVLNSKGLKLEHGGTMVLDIERGRADRILPEPWQTDTCIGEWHYRRSLYEQHRYKTARQVVQTLVDIVSKNGNLLLNIPLRGDGSIDDDESQVLDGLASWMPANGEAIFGSRPFTVFGEGAPDVKGAANFNENSGRAYTAQDIRFTTKGDILYAIALGWPEDGKSTIQTLAQSRNDYPKTIGRIELLGGKGPLPFRRQPDGLVLTLPETRPNEFAYVFKILPA
jgi:alpha-L-fucosidase